MLPWVLLMVLLNPVPGLESATILNEFATQEECQVERNRVGFEMAETYPNEADFRIECRERGVKAAAEVSKAEYDEMIKNFAMSRYPKQLLTIKVTDIKPIQNESGNLPLIAVQVSITHKDGIESFILIIRGKAILGWIDAGEGEEDETEEEEQFPGKEFA